MTTQEMCGHGPSIEAAFEAESAEACGKVLCSQSTARSTSIAHAMSMLLSIQSAEETLVLTTLQLFMLVHGMSSTFRSHWTTNHC